VTDVVDLLQQLNFSEYEARAYIALLQHNPLNGYALAKESGIPRANIYSVLQKLEERGAVIAIDTSSGMSYVPVPPDELIHHLSIRMDGILQAARHSLAQAAQPAEQDYVQNIQGYDELLQHARDLIQRGQHQLLLAVWQPEAQALADAIAAAETWGVAIRTLCFQACPAECGHCRGSIYRYHVTPNEDTRWLIVVRDDTDLVIGTTGEHSRAIRTQQISLIKLVTWYIQHSLALAAVLTDLGSDLEASLQPETRELLKSIGQGRSWLEIMHQLVQS
jgi:sugar-specific transcriptional regulator TrmB